MTAATLRRTRLTSEYEALLQLAQASSVFTFEAFGGDPPTRYTFNFQGTSLCPDDKTPTQIITCTQQRCDVILPVGYPESPPDVRWLTPVWHPNIGQAGVVNLEDIGLPWSLSAGLEVLCECLWDVARLAWVNPQRIVNQAAWQWYETHPEMVLPVDPRPLRGAYLTANRNVVKYSHRPKSQANSRASEVLYIGDDAGLPLPLPPRPLPPRAEPPREIVFLED